MKESPISRANGSVGEWKPTIIKISNGLGCEPSDLFNQEQINGFDVTTSTAEISREQMLSISEAAESSYDMSIDDEMHNKKITSAIFNSEALNEREKLVLKMIYGIGVNSEMTLGECGKVLNVTSERVKQIQHKALKKINEYIDEDGNIKKNKAARNNVIKRLINAGYSEKIATQLVEKHFAEMVTQKRYCNTSYIYGEILNSESKKWHDKQNKKAPQ
jgi:ribosomal protein S13